MAKIIAVVSTIEDALDELARNIVPIREFNPLGAYEYPLQSQRDVVLKFRTAEGNEIELPLTREEGVIKNLHLPWQFMLHERLQSQYGPLGHGSLEMQLKDCYHPDGQRYKKRVLDKFWVYTGEVGKQYENSHNFGQLVKVEPSGLPNILFEDESETFPKEDYRLIIRRVEVALPTKMIILRELEIPKERVIGMAHIQIHKEGLLSGATGSLTSWVSSRMRTGR